MEEYRVAVDEWKGFSQHIEKDSVLLSVLVNREFFARSLVDTGCEIYSMVNAKFAAKCKLPRI